MLRMHGQSWMATLLFAVIAFTGGYLAGLHGAPTPAEGSQFAAAHPASSECYFSPNGGCRDAVIDQIHRAQTSIEVQAFTLSSPAVGEALLGAFRRGLHVQILLDAAKTAESRDVASRLAIAGVPVYVDMTHGIADTRMVLIDNQTIATGSYNLSDAAEYENCENLVILHGDAQVQAPCRFIDRTAVWVCWRSPRRHLGPPLLRPPAVGAKTGVKDFRIAEFA